MWWPCRRPTPVLEEDGPLSSYPLFQAADMGVRNGGFRQPNISEYSGNSISYYDNSLFVEQGPGDDQNWFIRMSIPAAVDTGTITSMNRGELLNAGLVDPTNGTLASFNDPVNSGDTEGKRRLGGLFAYDGKLYGNASIVYDASNVQAVSHYRRNIDLDVSTGFEGYFTFGQANMSRYFSGHFCAVPTYAQSALGGPLLSLLAGGLSVNASTSVGPAAASFDPSDFDGKSHLGVVDANFLLYYNLAHPFQDNLHFDCGSGVVGATCPDIISNYWNQSTAVGGAFIPDGYRSLIFCGLHGTGAYCYGEATDDPELHGLPTGVGDDHWCYNPLLTPKGTHASGWRYQAWAYDLDDLAAVKSATLDPWDLFPYAIWELNIPNTYQTLLTGSRWAGSGNATCGVAYDPATRRVWFSQIGADPQAFSNHPVIWQWTHTVAS